MILENTNLKVAFVKLNLTEADLGGCGGRTPPLSEFETLVMGIFVPSHAPPPIPHPKIYFY